MSIHEFNIFHDSDADDLELPDSELQYSNLQEFDTCDSDSDRSRKEHAYEQSDESD